MTNLFSSSALGAQFYLCKKREDLRFRMTIFTSTVKRCEKSIGQDF